MKQSKEIKDGIIISATLILELNTSWLLDCEGDRKWFPKSECNYDKEKQELEAPKWLLNSRFPNEEF